MIIIHTPDFSTIFRATKLCIKIFRYPSRSVTWTYKQSDFLIGKDVFLIQKLPGENLDLTTLTDLQFPSVSFLMGARVQYKDVLDPPAP